MPVYVRDVFLYYFFFFFSFHYYYSRLGSLFPLVIIIIMIITILFSFFFFLLRSSAAADTDTCTDSRIFILTFYAYTCTSALFIYFFPIVYCTSKIMSITKNWSPAVAVRKNLHTRLVSWFFFFFIFFFFEQ